MPRLDDLGQLARYRHVVLSPHFDDAALSFGGTIARLADDDGPVLVVTMCAEVPETHDVTGTIARELSLRDGSAIDYVLRRRDEDLAAMRVLGADVYWETALDAIYRVPERYGESFELLFGDAVPNDPLRTRAAALLARILRESEASVWGPLGVGRHIDHHLTADAVLEAAERAPARVHLYEELPYAARPGELPHRLGAAGVELEPEVHAIARTIDRRLAAIAAYTSQVAPLFGSDAAMEREIRGYAGDPPIERTWRRARS